MKIFGSATWEVLKAIISLLYNNYNTFIEQKFMIGNNKLKKFIVSNKYQYFSSLLFNFKNNFIKPEKIHIWVVYWLPFVKTGQTSNSCSKKCASKLVSIETYYSERPNIRTVRELKVILLFIFYNIPKKVGLILLCNS